MNSITILFYPELPSKHSVIYKIVNILGCKITNDTSIKPDIIFHWEDTTFRKHFEFLKRNKESVINYKCSDISKTNVDNNFKEIFGYSSIIDPLTFDQSCVKKNNLNAEHDGEIIQCPVKTLDDKFIYQVLINNFNNKWGIYDIRVPIFRKTIPLVYIKQKDEAFRFKDEYKKVLIQDTSNIFTKEEYNLIINFCSRIGMDYGELDILRDSKSNLLYIIDANNTPWWSTSISKNESKRVIHILAKVFYKKFLAI